MAQGHMIVSRFGLMLALCASFLSSCANSLNTVHSEPALAPGNAPFVSRGIVPTNRPWLGFGNNEYPVMRDSSDNDAAWSESAFKLTTQRLDYIKPAITRINLYRDWFNPSGVVGSYNWTTMPMLDLFRLMDYYKLRGYIIQTGIWHDTNHSSNNVAFYTSTAFAQLQADLLKELIKVKGYTNIRYYAGINEFDCDYIGYSFSDWEVETHNLIQALQVQGLSRNLIIGPDVGCHPLWVSSTAQRDSGSISAYEYHWYPDEATVIAGGIENAVLATIAGVHAYDQPVSKPIYLAEMGVTDPDTGTSPPIDSYLYGLDMLDYGIQAGRAGAASAMAWCVDGFDLQKNCGLWDISGLNGGTKLRPWFYTWSLLNRYFPAQERLYTMHGSSQVRILAANLPVSQTQSHWSFALINRDTLHNQAIILQVPDMGSGLFQEYLYAPDNSPTDSNGFPRPTTVVYTQGNGANSSLTVTVPANSGIVLTTLDGQPLSSGVSNPK